MLDTRYPWQLDAPSSSGTPDLSVIGGSIKVREAMSGMEPVRSSVNLGLPSFLPTYLGGAAAGADRELARELGWRSPAVLTHQVIEGG